MKIGLFVQRCISLNPTQEKMRKMFVLTAVHDGRGYGCIIHYSQVAQEDNFDS